MRYWEIEQRIPLLWRVVVAAYWSRYPNPHSQHVFSVDTLGTRLEGDTLYARRPVMKTGSWSSSQKKTGFE